jgi:hypothetical protein
MWTRVVDQQAVRRIKPQFERNGTLTNRLVQLSCLVSFSRIMRLLSDASRAQARRTHVRVPCSRHSLQQICVGLRSRAPQEATAICQLCARGGRQVINTKRSFQIRSRSTVTERKEPSYVVQVVTSSSSSLIVIDIVRPSVRSC